MLSRLCSLGRATVDILYLEKSTRTEPSSPSAYQAAEHHTAADQGTRLLEAAHHTAAVPEAADHTVHPEVGTGQAVELHTDPDPDPDPAEADRTVHPEQAGRIGPGEVGHTDHLEEVRRIAGVVGRSLAGVHHRTDQGERRSCRVRGWSFRPWHRSCDRWHRGEA